MKRRVRMFGLALLAAVSVGTAALHRGEDGPLLGTIRVGAYPNAMLLHGASGRLFVLKGSYADGQTGAPGYIAALDPGRLSVLWTRRLQAGPISAAVDGRAGHTMVLDAANVMNNWESHATLLDTAGGLVLHDAPLGGEVEVSAADEQTGRVFVLSGDKDGGLAIVLDVRTGLTLRRTRVGYNPGALAIDTGSAGSSGHVFVANLCGGVALTCAGPGSVSILDGRDGRLLRTVAVGHNPTAVALDGRRGRVFVLNSGQSGGYQTGSRSVSVLDARTGVVLRTLAVDTGGGSLAVDPGDGRLFVLGATGVSSLDPSSGLLRSIPLGIETTALAVDAATHRVFVIGSDYRNLAGRLAVLDAHTGLLLRVRDAGNRPLALAIDERRGRVLLLDACAGGRPSSDPWRWAPAWLRRLLPGVGSEVPASDPCAAGSVSVYDGARL